MKTPGKTRKSRLKLIKNDPWLAPFTDAIEGRHREVLRKEAELTAQSGSLKNFANAYEYFGLHQTDEGWIFREYAPNATAIYLIGDFNDWKPLPKYKLKKIKGTYGDWELKLKPGQLKHGQYFKMLVEWPGGSGERIPAYAQRVVQAPDSPIFSAQVWAPEKPYKWEVKKFKPNADPLLIYECHIGMAQDKEGIGTYEEFRQNILPRVEKRRL